MNIGFILTTYDRIDDLLVHLDILKYFPHKYEIIPIWMNKNSPHSFIKEIDTYKNSQYVDGVSFRFGPLLGLIAGLRKAHELGLDYIVYRNGDDWLFNHEFVMNNFTILDRDNKDVAAYNWLTHDTMSEFAMNELYIRVNKFMETIDEAEHYFRHSSERWLCEFKIARWIKRTIESDDKFYRLPDREFWPGVGYEIETLPEIISKCDRYPDPSLWASLSDNHRFFNRKWQLIGSHNTYQRLNNYLSIRNDIKYASQLEREDNFSRWLSFFDGKNNNWNMTSSNEIKDTLRLEMAKKMMLMKPLVLKRVTKKMPKRFIKK